MNILALLVNYLNGAYVAEYAPEREKKMKKEDEDYYRAMQSEGEKYDRYYLRADGEVIDLPKKETKKERGKKMKTKHTPGPWEARDVSQNWIEILGEEENNSKMVLATVLPTQYAHLGKSEEQKATARLIASAPDLLEALKLLTEEIKLINFKIRQDFSLINCHANALKAIDKAEGNE